MSQQQGILPGQMIRSLIKTGRIKNAQEAAIGAAGLDLHLSEEVYRVGGAMLPQPGQYIGDLLGTLSYGEKPQLVVERGGKIQLVPKITYLARLQESLALSQNLEASADARSQAGRLDMHVRVVVEASSSPRFNKIPAGYHGALWVFIRTQTFTIDLEVGASLVQMRIFDADTRLGKAEVGIDIDLYRMLWSSETRTPYLSDDFEITDKDGSCLFTLDTQSEVLG